MLSAVFQRSSWRYGDRGYRRILLDCGHALGNLQVFAPELGLQIVNIPDFRDDALNSLLFFDGANEGMLTMAAVVDENDSHPVLPPRVAQTVMEADKADLSALHRAAFLDELSDQKVISRPDKGALPGETTALPMKLPAWDGKLCASILERRSARGFTGGPLPLEELGKVLGFAYAPQKTEDDGLLASGWLRTWVISHRVSDLQMGVHHFDPSSGLLRCIRVGSFEGECHQFCLGQELGRDAACLVVHTVDLDQAVNAYGDRAYRKLGLDAGHIGQRIYLAAQREGLGCTGIGGYFDDEINSLLRLKAQEAIVYVMCLGQLPQEF